MSERDEGVAESSRSLLRSDSAGNLASFHDPAAAPPLNSRPELSAKVAILQLAPFWLDIRAVSHDLRGGV